VEEAEEKEEVGHLPSSADPQDPYCMVASPSALSSSTDVPYLVILADDQEAGRSNSTQDPSSPQLRQSLGEEKVEDMLTIDLRRW
ncbi:hypothetical protein FRC17_002599, partial [Serendipita sp. 399]